MTYAPGFTLRAAPPTCCKNFIPPQEYVKSHKFVGTGGARATSTRARPARFWLEFLPRRLASSPRAKEPGMGRARARRRADGAGDAALEVADGGSGGGRVPLRERASGGHHHLEAWCPVLFPRLQSDD